jgi:hypothetical protein
METSSRERLALSRRSLLSGAGKVALGGGLLAPIALTQTAHAAPATATGRTPTPTGFVKYLVYMQNGVIDPSTPAPDTGEFFQTEVMGRSAAEIEADRQAAIAFYQRRFGLDFSGGDTDGAASFGPFMDARRNNYRAYTISGENVPGDGWFVDGGGWMVQIGAGGMTLRGSYGGAGGQAVPEGSAMVFGEYFIHRPDGRSARLDPIIIHFESERPIIGRPDGVISFQCGLSHPEWGEGVAEGVAVPPLLLDDGRVKVAVRNVLTFPPI